MDVLTVRRAGGTTANELLLTLLQKNINVGPPNSLLTYLSTSYLTSIHRRTLAKRKLPVWRSEEVDLAY